MKESSLLDEDKPIKYDTSLLSNNNSPPSKNSKENQIKENIRKYFNEHQKNQNLKNNPEEQK